MHAQNLFQLFTDVARRHGDRPALRFQDRDISYSELADRSRKAADLLAASGVTQGDVVCICVEKSPSAYALLLACLRIGAPYCFLDPENPWERQRKVLAQCEPVLLAADGSVLDKGLHDLAQSLGIKPVPLASFDHATSPSDSHTRGSCEPGGDDPAYIMFTSGSTGTPKGAVMTHQNVLKLITWSQNYFSFGAGDVLTNVNPLFFDNSVFDIYSSLFTGATLAPFTREETRNAAMLLDGLDKRHCTSWFSVPSLLMYLDSLRALRSDAMAQVKRIIFGGEGYPLTRLKKLFDTFGSRAEIVNVYGPTECTCICSAYRLVAEDFMNLRGFPPLGELTPEFKGLIMDEDGNPAPEGELGELVLCGPCVGAGYYHDVERTEQSFRQNPIHDDFPDTVYYTGDLVRRDPKDGKLWIHGRVDNQIKHMGYRIELEEIEAALCTVPGIRQATAVHVQRYGNSSIAAMVSAETRIEEHEIHEHLRNCLPHYMIPSTIYQADELPKNKNGKVDRRRIRDLLASDDKGVHA